MEEKNSVVSCAKYIKIIQQAREDNQDDLLIATIGLCSIWSLESACSNSKFQMEGCHWIGDVWADGYKI